MYITAYHAKLKIAIWFIVASHKQHKTINRAYFSSKPCTCVKDKISFIAVKDKSKKILTRLATPLPVMLTMKVSFPSGMASFWSSRMALAVVTPDEKLTTVLELKKSLSTEVLVTCRVR